MSNLVPVPEADEYLALFLVYVKLATGHNDIKGLAKLLEIAIGKPVSSADLTLWKATHRNLLTSARKLLTSGGKSRRSIEALMKEHLDTRGFPVVKRRRQKDLLVEEPSGGKDKMRKVICPGCKKDFEYVPVTPYTEGPITYQGYEPNCPYCGTSVRNVPEVKPVPEQ